MRIALDVLRRHIDAPEDVPELRRLMDEQGLEVKRVEHDGTDNVFVLELLANRGDHHCYEGVARELDGRLGVGIRLPAIATLEVGESPWPLRCDTDLCLRYTATLMQRKKKNRTLDADAMRTLQGAQIHSLQAPVDASNVANLELGQPTHAFDADTIVGAVTIRLSRAGESALPLFAEEQVDLPEGILVIADDEKILAVAGVIGCEESKTTERTKRLLLESACFDPVAVRKASRALSIHTDSSARFERGSDPERTLAGAGRVVQLLEAHAGWERVGATGLVGDYRDPERSLELRVDQANRFLSTELSAEDVSARLQRYGFSCRTESEGVLQVSVPSWRLWDVAHPADLYEELAKSVGYDTTPIELPSAGLGAQPSAEEERRDRVEEVLLGYGFQEVFTDGFYGRRVIELLGLPPGHPLQSHMHTLNAMERGYSMLKNNCLHQALEAVAVNERRRTLDGKFYEWTRTFHPTGVEDASDRATSPCTEQAWLWLTSFSVQAPHAWSATSRVEDGVWHLKGIVDELSVELGLALITGPLPDDHPLAVALHPGRRAAILLEDRAVGVLGEVHPAVLRRYKIKTVRPSYLEIQREALLSDGSRPPYEEPPSAQPIARSVAFAIPSKLEAASVAECMSRAGPDWLQKVEITDVFVVQTDEGEGPSRSVTFELTYANPENLRSADEVNQTTEAVVRAVHTQFGPRGVQQR